MAWIIKRKDESNGRIGEKPYDTDEGFRAALSDIFNNPTKQRFISATLPDGTVLDEAAAKALVNFTVGKSGVGESSIG